MRIKIVSWNIAGGRTTKTPDQFDYADQNLNYFTKNILELNPDIVCMQEMETDADNTQIKIFKERLAMDYFYVPSHKSHINNDFVMGNTIFTKLDFIKNQDINLPKPNWIWCGQMEKKSKNLIKKY